MSVIIHTRGEAGGGVAAHLQCPLCGHYSKSHAHQLSHMAASHPACLDDVAVGRLGNILMYQSTARLFHCSSCFFTSRDFTKLYKHIISKHCTDERADDERGEEEDDTRKRSGEEEDDTRKRGGEEEDDARKRSGEEEEDTKKRGGEEEDDTRKRGEEQDDTRKRSGEEEEDTRKRGGEEEEDTKKRGGEEEEDTRKRGGEEEDDTKKRKRSGEEENPKKRSSEEEQEEGLKKKSSEAEEEEAEHRDEDGGPQGAESVKSEADDGVLLFDGAGYHCLICGWRNKLKGMGINHVVRKHDIPRRYASQAIKRDAAATKQAQSSAAAAEEDEAAAPLSAHMLKEEVEAMAKVVRFVSNRFVCQICGWKTKLKGFAISHVARSHDVERPFSCSDCSRCFFLPSQLQQHIGSAHRPGRYACPFCCFRSHFLGGFRRHCSRCNAREEEGGRGGGGEGAGGGRGEGRGGAGSGGGRGGAAGEEEENEAEEDEGEEKRLVRKRRRASVVIKEEEEEEEDEDEDE